MTANSAKITWEAGKSETQWQYICVAKDGIVLWDGITPTTDKFATVTGLSSNTEYDFYVRSYCAVGDQSEAVKITFKTEVSCFQPETATVSNVTATGAKAKEIREDGVLCDTAEGEKLFPADTVVLALGVEPLWDEVDALSSFAGEFYLAGDCRKPRSIMAATGEAWTAANLIGRY